MLVDAWEIPLRGFERHLLVWGKGSVLKGASEALPVTALYWIVCLAPWKWAFFFSWDWNLERLLWCETAFDSHSPFLAPQLGEELLARASVLVAPDCHRKESELWNVIYPTRVFGNKSCL